MKNSIILSLTILLVLVVGSFVFSSYRDLDIKTIDTITDVNAAANAEDVQKITLGMKNYNYYPNTITVKEGRPVELTLDDSIYGCLRSFTVKDLGVSKYSRSSGDVITFTPTKKGTFRFSCSMGMGYGTIIVE